MEIEDPLGGWMKIFPLVLCAVLCPALAQDVAPTAESLLRKAIEFQKSQEANGWKYTFREDEDKLPRDAKGQLGHATHRTYDNIMLEGDNYRKLVLIDGKPPDPKLQKKIDAEMEKERAARKAHPKIGRHEVRIGGLEQILKMCNSRVTGSETVGGRKAWRIESLPKPDYQPANEEEKRVLALRRIVWVDDSEGALLKTLDVFIQPAVDLLPGTEFETTYTKIGDAWLCDGFVFRYLAFGGHRRGESRSRFYDFKKFEVESKIVE